MAFEVVVRPVVFPDVRPPPARSLPPPDDPTQGFCTIKGNGASHVDLTSSYSVNQSKSVQTETKRRYDVARIYQMGDDGNVSEDNFVDIEVANKIWMKGEADNIYNYDPVQEADNIEIRERNKVRKSGE